MLFFLHIDGCNVQDDYFSRTIENKIRYENIGFNGCNSGCCIQL